MKKNEARWFAKEDDTKKTMWSQLYITRIGERAWTPPVDTAEKCRALAGLLFGRVIGNPIPIEMKKNENGEWEEK